MGIGPEGAARLVRSDRAAFLRLPARIRRSTRYRRHSGVFVDLGKALAAFLETQVTGRTPFDDFRDALARNDAVGQARYPAAAQRGLRLFIGRGNCVFCHFGPTFTNSEFADAGVPHFVEPGRVDPGRHGGIRKLRQSPYTLLGRFNDDAGRSTAAKTRYVRLRQSNFGEFRVPGLRNVALTAPYMHAGSLATLADVARHYSTLDEERLHAGGERILRRLDLSARERADPRRLSRNADGKRTASRIRRGNRNRRVPLAEADPRDSGPSNYRRDGPRRSRNSLRAPAHSGPCECATP